MRELVEDFTAKLETAVTLDACLDLLSEAAGGLGFSAIIYDYTPVSRSHDGVMIAPSVMRTRNVPESFIGLWCDGGYYRIDPVQQICIDSSIPFTWSHLRSGTRIQRRPLTREHQPVVQYLKESRLTCGATVPIHSVEGGLATVTAIRIDPERAFLEEANRQLGTFSLLAQHLHRAAYRALPPADRSGNVLGLTARELECLRWAARGKTAQDIAVILDRSLATVCLHLNNAMRKLGAQNRAQAIAHASHYRLIGSSC